MTYGLWDGRDKCWIGNDAGPLRYDDHLLARAAATVATEQFQRYIVPRKCPRGPFLLKDSVVVKFTGADAIGRIEKGL